VGKTYYEYSITDASINKIVSEVFIAGDTDDKGWILGQWYRDEDSVVRQTIQSADGLHIANLIETHYDTEGGELF
jgi:hypothetical protein